MTEFSRRDLAGLVPAAVASVALANVAAEPALAAAPPPSSGDALLPVSAAKNGFTPAQAREFLGKWGNATGMAGGDVSLFRFSQSSRGAALLGDPPRGRRRDA